MFGVDLRYVVVVRKIKKKNFLFRFLFGVSDSMYTNDKRLWRVRDCDVPVVGEEFLKDAASGDALIKIPKHKISSWGEVRHSACLDSVGGMEDESKYIATGNARSILLPSHCS